MNIIQIRHTTGPKLGMVDWCTEMFGVSHWKNGKWIGGRWGLVFVTVTDTFAGNGDPVYRRVSAIKFTHSEDAILFALRWS